MRKETVGQAQTASPESERTGLAPAAARDWLELQRVLAWEPEAVGSMLRAGIKPKAVLESLRPRIAAQTGRSGRTRFLSTGNGIDPRCVGSAAWPRELEQLERLALRVIPLTDAAYPLPLAALADAPPVLLVRGSAAVLSSSAVAIVGARAATQGARATARRLGRELAAAGLTIVSGLARGIDAEAHRGALEGRGRTIGVLACGPDRIYPPEHRKLAEEMVEVGAVVSEMPLGVPPRRAHFPLRNRIISGLCRAVIVVEARRRSGSLITVRHALEQGREVFVIPGSIDGPFAEGTNQLLRDGARPICCAADVLEDLGFQAPLDLRAGGRDSPSGQAVDADSLEGQILVILEAGPITRDRLLSQLGSEVAELAGALLDLELAGRIMLERDGRIYARWR